MKKEGKIICSNHGPSEQRIQSANLSSSGTYSVKEDAEAFRHGVSSGYKSCMQCTIGVAEDGRESNETEMLGSCISGFLRPVTSCLFITGTYRLLHDGMGCTWILGQHSENQTIRAVL